MAEKTVPEFGRVLFMLDEFAQLGPMPLIENAASIVRDYRIQLYLVLQNLPQLITLYGRERAESFLSSAGVVQALTPNDLTTAEWLSKRSGIKTTLRPSFGQSSSTGSGPGGASSSSGTSTNYTQVEEPYYKPHEIMEFGQTVQALVVPGLARLVLANRLPYFDQTHLQDLYAKDPYQMSSAERAQFEADCRAGKFDYSGPVEKKPS